MIDLYGNNCAVGDICVEVGPLASVMFEIGRVDDYNVKIYPLAGSEHEFTKVESRGRVKLRMFPLKGKQTAAYKDGLSPSQFFIVQTVGGKILRSRFTEALNAFSAIGV